MNKTENKLNVEKIFMKLKKIENYRTEKNFNLITYDKNNRKVKFYKYILRSKHMKNL